MKKLHKFLVLNLVISLVILLGGCGAKKEEGIKEFFNAVNKCDTAEMKKFLGEDSKLVSFDNSVQQALVETIYKNLKYKVVSSSKEEIEVEITTPDGISLFAEGSNILMNAQIAGKTEVEDFPEQLEKIIDREGFPKNITNIKIKIQKKSEKWCIEENKELENAVTGNLI